MSILVSQLLRLQLIVSPPAAPASPAAPLPSTALAAPKIVAARFGFHTSVTLFGDCQSLARSPEASLSLSLSPTRSLPGDDWVSWTNELGQQMDFCNSSDCVCK